MFAREDPFVMGNLYESRGLRMVYVTLYEIMFTTGSKTHAPVSLCRDRINGHNVGFSGY